MITLILFFRSEDAGLIPQSLSLIFQKIQQHSQHEAFTVHISFFEIYRETAYDLLGCFLFNGSKKYREMPKVRTLCNYQQEINDKSHATFNLNFAGFFR